MPCRSPGRLPARLLWPDKDLEEVPEYTLSQLASRNGQDREEIWIAYQGLIYDVSESRLWRRGFHYEHWAGQDLTAELKDAPHTERVFERLKVIGRLKGVVR